MDDLQIFPVGDRIALSVSHGHDTISVLLSPSEVAQLARDLCDAALEAMEASKDDDGC